MPGRSFVSVSEVKRQIFQRQVGEKPGDETPRGREDVASHTGRYVDFTGTRAYSDCVLDAILGK